jgi:hypothetical protein
MKSKRLKGNTHASKGRILKAHRQIFEESRTSLPYFQISDFLNFYQALGVDNLRQKIIPELASGSDFFLNRLKPNERELFETTAKQLDVFLMEYRERDFHQPSDYKLSATEVDLAIESGIFNSYLDDTSHLDVDAFQEGILRKNIVRARYHNQAKGNKLGTHSRKSKRVVNGRRVKLSYKPSIPSHTSGNGELVIRLYPDPDFLCSNTGVIAVSSDGGEYYRAIFEHEQERSQAPKYQDRYEPEQTIPKIEWREVRRYRSDSKSYKHMQRDLREHTSIRERLKTARDTIQGVPKRRCYITDY